jgi:DNA invertase Pin-like site-specific DNA recombinase
MRYRGFIRVSDERQDQATQEAAVGRHADSQRYVPAGEPYRMNGSAYHGRQLGKLQQAIDDMQAGEFDVLVCSASSRLWRGRSAARAVVMIEDAEERGARFDFVGEPHLNTNPEMPKQALDAMRMQAFGVNRIESDMKSERSKNTHAMHRATGSVSGREPWGTVITCEDCGHVTTRLEDGSVSRCGHKHAKKYVATDEARRLIPQIIARAIKGESTMSMAPWLSNKTLDTWHETLVGRIIRRGSFYADLGLVTHSDASAALAAYESRARGGRTASVRDPALLVPVCPCGAKMYRCFGGKDGLRDAWYRCYAKCGRKMLRCSDLDAVVTEAMESDLSPHKERVWVAGTDAADKAAKLRAEAMKAYAAGDKARFLELDAQADVLDAEKKVRPHWELQEVPGVTEASYFSAMTREQQREYMRKHVVTAYLDTEEGIPVVSITPR